MRATDNREAIMARLVEIAGMVVPPANVARNTIDIPESALPALLIFDADEEADTSAESRSRPASGPIVVTMSPEIYLRLEGDSGEIGATINEYRRKLLKAVLTDQTLVALCKDRGLGYGGMATGFAAGRSMMAEAGFSFSFTYVIRPEQL